MAKIKAPRGVIGQTASQKSESATSWYSPVLAFYYGNQRIVTGLAIGIILVIAGIFGYNYIQGERDVQAQELLGEIILEFERGEYRIALDGSGEILGLLDIVERYGETRAGNTARFYAGNAHFELQEYDSALVQFENYDVSDDFIGASVTAGRAAIHELNGELVIAADLFLQAADMDENPTRAPYYLRSAVRAYVEAEQFEEAEEVIQDAIENYPETDLLDEFNFMLGLVLARQ